MLDILYSDDDLIAINKPHGLLVHQSSIARDAEEFALQLLRDQVNQHVSPVHRIDRKTSGVLLFAFNKPAERMMHKQFAETLVKKKYLAIVRGFAPDNAEVDYPLRKENGQLQDAVTHFTTLARAELAIPLGAHPTSRYSLLDIRPVTGRMHQIRKHLAHIHHPIIGDRPHGCNKQNKLFKDRWAMDTMLLHAAEINFEHPATQQSVKIAAPLHPEFVRMMTLMGWDNYIGNYKPSAVNEVVL